MWKNSYNLTVFVLIALVITAETARNSISQDELLLYGNNTTIYGSPRFPASTPNDPFFESKNVEFSHDGIIGPQNAIEYEKKSDNKNDIVDISLGVCDNFTANEIQEISFILQSATELFYRSEILTTPFKTSASCDGVLNKIKKDAYYIVQQLKFIKQVQQQNNHVYTVLNTNYEKKLNQFIMEVGNLTTYYKNEIFTFIKRFKIDLKSIENIDIENRENIKKEILLCIKLGQLIPAKDKFLNFLDKDIILAEIVQKAYQKYNQTQLENILGFLNTLISFEQRVIGFEVFLEEINDLSDPLAFIVLNEIQNTTRDNNFHLHFQFIKEKYTILENKLNNSFENILAAWTKQIYISNFSGIISFFDSSDMCSLCFGKYLVKLIERVYSETLSEFRCILEFVQSLTTSFNIYQGYDTLLQKIEEDYKLNEKHKDFEKEVAFFKMLLSFNQRIPHYENLVDRLINLNYVLPLIFFDEINKVIYNPDFELNSQLVIDTYTTLEERLQISANNTILWWPINIRNSNYHDIVIYSKYSNTTSLIFSNHLAKFIEEVYDGHLDNFKSTLEFVQNLALPLHTLIGYETLIRQMRDHDSLYTPEFITLAFNINHARDTSNETKDKFDEIIDKEFPGYVKEILKSKECFFKSYDVGEYIFLKISEEPSNETLLVIGENIPPGKFNLCELKIFDNDFQIKNANRILYVCSIDGVSNGCDDSDVQWTFFPENNNNKTFFKIKSDDQEMFIDNTDEYQEVAWHLISLTSSCSNKCSWMIECPDVNELISS